VHQVSPSTPRCVARWGLSLQETTGVLAAARCMLELAASDDARGTSFGFSRTTELASRRICLPETSNYVRRLVPGVATTYPGIAATISYRQHGTSRVVAYIPQQGVKDYGRVRG
jgi:hypothetical protein